MLHHMSARARLWSLIGAVLLPLSASRSIAVSTTDDWFGLRTFHTDAYSTKLHDRRTGIVVSMSRSSGDIETRYEKTRILRRSEGRIGAVGWIHLDLAEPDHDAKQLLKEALNGASATKDSDLDYIVVSNTPPRECPTEVVYVLEEPDGTSTDFRAVPCSDAQRERLFSLVTAKARGREPAVLDAADLAPSRRLVSADLKWLAGRVPVDKVLDQLGRPGILGVSYPDGFALQYVDQSGETVVVTFDKDRRTRSVKVLHGLY